MVFFTEPDHYVKTILSDLQGAWGCLRGEVVKHAGFPNWDRLLFHVDEAMSWETVRHLERMEPRFQATVFLHFEQIQQHQITN